MPQPGPGQGHGTTIQFENGFFAKIRNVSLVGVGDRDVIDLSNMDDDFDDNDPSDIIKCGELRVTLLFDPRKRPPYDAPPSNFIMQNKRGVYLSGTAWLRDPGAEIPHDREMMQTCTLKMKTKPNWGQQ